MNKPEKPRREDPHIRNLQILSLVWILLCVFFAIGHYFYPARIHIPRVLLPTTLCVVGILIFCLISQYLREKGSPPDGDGPRFPR